MITIDIIKDCLNDAIDVVTKYLSDYKYVDLGKITLTKSTRYLAQIEKVSFKNDLMYTLRVSETIFNSFTSFNSMKHKLTGTLIHELIHTCPGCYNHGSLFKNHCKIINKNTDYNIWTTTNLSELENFDYVKFSKAREEKIKSKIRYHISCPKCGRDLGTYVRKCKCVQQPQLFVCNYCKHWGLKVTMEELK